jgi:hypothetical protein
VLLALTKGAESPFFLYLLFPLLAATLRWGLRGTLWTAAAAVVVLIGAWVGGDAGGLVVRAALLAVVAVLLGVAGAQGEAAEARLLRLARGPRSIALHAEELARDALRHAALVEAPRVVMAWEDQEEPWLNVASSAGGEVVVGREAPGAWEPLVSSAVSGAGFLCEDASVAVPVVVRETPVNAARHAQASRVTVSVAGADGRLRIAVADDGRGFRFRGRREGDELRAGPETPRSLRERVEMLGGRLVVDSSEAGARVEAELPLDAGEA